jgi:predicted Zn-dependent protease
MSSPHRRSTAPAAAAAVLLCALCALGALGSDTAGARSSFNLISVDEEWAMRGALHQEASQQLRLVNDPPAVNYVNQLGRRIVDQTPLRGRRWDFFIVNDPAVNAFTLPGGLVYINRGLIEEASSLDELAGAMAHEIGHGNARHGTQLMTKAYGYNLVASLLLGRNAGRAKRLFAQLLGTGLLTHYSRDAEREADRLGVGYAYQAGFDPQGSARLFRELLRLQGRQPGRVGQFFASHPLTQERIVNAEATAAQYRPRPGLIHDTPVYHQLQARLR